MKIKNNEKGAAILTSMLTVTVVATLAAGALTVQWRNVQVEQAGRSQVQAAWILRGAMDWSRLILRQDAMSSEIDHLSEPWAVPLKEAKISSFIAADNGVANADASADMADAYIAGSIEDAHSKFNLVNLAYDPKSEYLNGLMRVFERRGLPSSEAELIANGFKNALHEAPTESTPLLAQSLGQLTWYGVKESTIEAIAPFTTIVNAVVKVNVNTASLDALLASDSQLSVSDATRIVTERKSKHFTSIGNAQSRTDTRLDEEKFSTTSNHFNASGAVSLENIALAMNAQIRRVGTEIQAKQISIAGTASTISN